MQPPTCINVRIRSTQDAHRIFYAVQEGILPMVTKRLDAEDRSALRSGCVYVWEERGAQGEITGLGIERFTEGRRWTPSRVRDEFLFYYEREPTPRSHDWDQMVKQTYSVWVDTERGRRKWHLTAYFTDKTVNDLKTIDDVPPLKDLVVIPGLYQSTRVAKSRQKSEEQSSSSRSLSKAYSTNARTYASFSHHNHYSVDASLLTSESLTMFDPYQNVNGNQYPGDLSDPSTERMSQTPIPAYPRLPEAKSHANSSNCGNTGAPDLRAATGSSSMVLPSPPSTRLAAWGAAPMTVHPSQSIPRGIPSRYDYTESYSLPPVSSIWNEHQLPPVGGALPSPLGRNISAHNSPYITNSGLVREPSYELSSREGNGDNDTRRESPGGPSDRELALAPIHALERRHPYRRDPLDDKTLRLLPG